MTKHWLKLILIGLTLILISFVLTGFNYEKLIKPFKENNEYTEKTYTTDLETLDTIKLQAKNSSIKIIPTNNDEIKVTYYESKYNKISINTNNNTLSIIETIKIQIISFNFNFFNKTITIEIPKEQILMLDIETSNGSIDINNLKNTDTNLKTTNGKIIINNINTNNLIANTINGIIELKNINANHINTKTGNGKVVLKQIKTNNLIVKTANALIDLKDIEATKKLEAKTSNGKIEFNNIVSENIVCETSNGQITGLIEDSEKNYNSNFKTSNSKITINNDEYGKTYKRTNDTSKNITLKTSNGKIEMTYTK